MMMHISGKFKFLKPVKYFFALIRPVNLLLVLLTTYLMYKAVIGGIMEYHLNMSLHMSTLTFIWLAISLVLVSAGGYVINDYYDISIDKENKPNKQIVGTHISPAATLVLYAVLTIGGLAAGVIAAFNVANYHLIILEIMFALALWFYSQNLKYTTFWGNFVIGISTAFVIIMVWLFEFFAMVKQNDFIHPKKQELLNAIILGYAAFAFISTFLREMVKDKEDELGDSKLNVKSLAVQLSDKGFKMFSSSLFLLNLLMLVVAQVFLFKIELAYAGWFVFLHELIILYSGWLQLKANKQKDYTTLSWLLKGYIAAGILSMQILYISW